MWDSRVRPGDMIRESSWREGTWHYEAVSLKIGGDEGGLWVELVGPRRGVR